MNFAMWDNTKWNATLLSSPEDVERLTSTYINKLWAIFQIGKDIPSSYEQRVAFQAVFVATLKLPETAVSRHNTFESDREYSDMRYCHILIHLQLVTF